MGLGNWRGWDGVGGRTLEPGVVPGHEAGVDEADGAGT